MVTLYVGAVLPTPPTSPFYRLYRRGAGAQWLHYVPSTNFAGPMASGSGQWFSLNESENGVIAIRAASRRLDPFPAPASWTTQRAKAPSHAALAAVLLSAVSAAAVLAGFRGTNSAS